MHLVEVRVDLGLVARRLVVAEHDLDRAPERDAGLDAHHHRHLPGVDDLPGLERRPHDPVEALAGAAELGVDVVLELVHVGRLQPDGVHVVARVPLDRVELAELVVLDQEVDEEPLPAAPGPLEPPVVGALVGQRVRSRPVLERRPADRVVRRLAGQEGLEDRAVALGHLVVRAVDQGVRRAVGVPRSSAVHVAAEELEGHAVGVRVDVAAHLLEGRHAAVRVAVDVDLGLRVAGAVVLSQPQPVGRHHVAADQVAPRGGEPVAVEGAEREPTGVAPQHRPVRGRARLGRELDGAAVAGEHTSARVQQVATEPGRLEEERSRVGSRNVGQGDRRAFRDEVVAGRRLQAVARAGHLVAGRGYGGVRRVGGHRRQPRVGARPLALDVRRRRMPLLGGRRVDGPLLEAGTGDQVLGLRVVVAVRRGAGRVDVRQAAGARVELGRRLQVDGATGVETRHRDRCRHHRRGGYRRESDPHRLLALHA